MHHIAFRTDATNQIGTGHFMRCLTLADGLKQRGAQIRFVSRDLPAHLRDMLTAKNMGFVSLGSDVNPLPSGDLAHASWLGTGQAQDAQATIHALSDQSWDWLVVDHYALDARWESALRGTAKKIMVIDDIADRQHDCEMLLDQNLYGDMQTRYIGKVPAHCLLLLGPRYALLREEFRRQHEQTQPRSGSVKRILVFLGGVDADNYTGSVVEALSQTDGLHVDVVIGAQHPCREQIKAACAQHGFICHVQTDKMAGLMAGADLAIGAGGSATWERCCLGLPTLTICVADNQSKQIVDSASEGLLYALELKGELIPLLKRHLSVLMENNSLRHVLSRNGMQAVDGYGVMRVIGNLEGSDIKIRAAIPNDSQNLFEWRNHPTIRAVSRNADIINWETHQRWFATVLGDPERLLLIGEHEDLPVGVVRFDIQGDEAEISIYLVPSVHQPGQGRYLLQNAERWFKANRPTVCKVRANVLGGNERSQRLFLGAGYEVELTRYSKRLH